jgi:methyl-accepting chemotaxis protein
MLDWFLTCHAPTLEQARRGRLLNWFLLIFATFALINVSWTLLVGIFDVGLILLLLVGLLLGIYALNRRGAVNEAAAGLVGLLFLVIHILCITPAGGVVAAGMAPTLLGIPIVLAGVTLSWRALPFVAGLAALDTVWLYMTGLPALTDYWQTNFVDMVVLVFSTLTLLCTLGLLAALSGRQIQTSLAALRQRNEELEAANHTLAQQRRGEQELGAGIGALADRLAAVSRREVRGVAVQTQAIHQVVGAVAQLNNAAQQIAVLAAEVSAAGAGALERVQQAQALVRHSRTVVQQNRVQIEAVIAGMHMLEQGTAPLIGFMHRMRELSDETQLLALNATIEAAGAGTRGQRFGVVAVEVQHLARRASEIVEQLQAVIGSVQKAGQQARDATLRSMAVADDVDRLTDELERAQAQVESTVQRTSDLGQRIQTATDQQTTDATQMAQTVQQIAQVAEETSENTTGLERAVDEMARAALVLTSTLAQRPAPPGGHALGAAGYAPGIGGLNTG